MRMDMPSDTKTISASEKAEMQERLSKGVPLFVEIDEIVSDDTIKGGLVLSAFGAPIDTKVHVKQLYTHSHIDSLSRHIKGSDFMPALKKGDIVCFDRVFIDDGDALAAKISARTHDRMRGNVQFVKAMARASSTSVNKRGAQQYLTIADGSSAYRIFDTTDLRKAYAGLKEEHWTAGGGGFIVMVHNRRPFEYHIDKDNPLEALIEDLEARRVFAENHYIEVIPVRKFPVGREQVMRDVDVRNEASKVYGNVGKQFLAPKSVYPGYRPCGIILCDEDEWAFGGKTGKIQRVAAGIQPLGAATPLDASHLPTRIHSNRTRTVMGVEGLYTPETMERLAKDRDSRRPPEDNVAPARGGSYRSSRPAQDWRGPDNDEPEDNSRMPFSFGPGGKLIG